MTGLLIFIGLILVILNVLSIKKQNKSFNGMLGNAIENTHDYDIRIGELKREFSESILELQSELMHMKEFIAMKEIDEMKEIKVMKEIKGMKKNNDTNKNLNTSYLEDIHDIESKEKIYHENKSEIVIDETPNKNSEKVEEIKRLFSQGLSVEEISEIMHLGKGEVLLIKDLYIR